MTSTLYIIGNGFDRHHGIKSRYKDFGAFLKASDPKTCDLIEGYFAIDEFWSDFEAGLANFDADTLIDRVSDFLSPYGAEDWSDSSHHDYQFEIEQVVDALSTGLKSHFAKWIRQLKMPDPVTIPSQLLRLDTSATFLNFNYTPSLTALYGGWSPNDRGSSNAGLDLEDTDTRKAEGNRIIDRYFERTFKPTGRVIAAHQSFFGALQNIQEILVMGHSLSDVDLPYFKEIIRNVDGHNVRWRFSYHHDDDRPKFRERLDKLGVAGHLVEFARMTDM
jgi:hypothetical protein